MIVSVHLPKTAGTSFLSVLETCFGASMMHDYGDYPINTDVSLRNNAASNANIKNGDGFPTGIACIHGHFLPIKYLLMSSKRPVKFITWMRDPVERLLSHYYFWKRRASPLPEEMLRKKMLDENWSLERFCLSNELRNIYEQFLWNFSLDNFDFIGITEYYAEDLKYFSQSVLGRTAKIKYLNVNKKSAYQYDIDPSFRKRIEIFHEIDMELYQLALKKRLERLISQ